MKSKSNKVIHLNKKSPTYWKVILDNPPLNIIGPKEVPELVSILEEMEDDPNLQVVVFESAVPGVLLAPLGLFPAARSIHLNEARSHGHASFS